MSLRDLFARLRQVLVGFFEARATGFVDFEVSEARGLFGVLVFSPLFGLPLVPAGVCLELLPLMEDRLRIALARMSDLDDVLGLLAGRFDIE
jgi:hypothetical protein